MKSWLNRTIGVRSTQREVVIVCSAEAYDSYTTIIEHHFNKQTTNALKKTNNPNGPPPPPTPTSITEDGCKTRITQVCVGPLVGVPVGSGLRGVYTEEINTATLRSQNGSDISHGTIYSPTRRYEITHTPQPSSQPANSIDENQKDSMNKTDDRIGVNLADRDPDSDPDPGGRKPLCAVIELTQLPYTSSGI
jgi:hypothetical protein